MPRMNPRRSREFLPRFHGLENRRLLSAIGVTSLGQDGVDLTGPGMSLGPDGIQDIHLQLTSLQTAQVSQIQVTGPSGTAWNFGGNSQGAANASFFQAADYSGSGESNDRYGTFKANGDLYINPTINPIGGAAGTPYTLHTGDQLNFVISYATLTSQDTGQVTLGAVANPLLTMTQPSTPQNINVSSSISVKVLGQDNSPSITQGFVHLQVTGLPGTISTAEINDQFGEYEGGNWAFPYTGSSGHWAISVNQSSHSTVADIFFPPVRDETRALTGTSPAANMSLRLTFSGDSNQYVTQFTGGSWNPGLMAISPVNSSQPLIANTASDLITDINNVNSGTATSGVISLQQATYILTQPLQLLNSVKILGNGATITFHPTAWATGSGSDGTLVPGAISTSGKYSSDYVIDLENLTINFNGASQNAWFDPNNDNGSTAVINLHNSSQSRQSLTLSGVTIMGPAAYTPASWPNNDNPSNDLNQVEVAMNLVDTGDYDSGTVTTSKFQGGPVVLRGGPWTVGGIQSSLGNVHYGSMAETASYSAFTFQHPHDLIFENNFATQNDTSSNDPNSSIHSDPNGHLFRLINLQSSGFNDSVIANTFSGGWLGTESSYTSSNGHMDGPNDPESVLAEGGYSTIYEGQVGAISADGRLLVLPPQSTKASSSWSGDTLQAGPGMVVAIINTQNGDGSTNTQAGQYYLVGQQVSLSPPTFLMQTPLPPVTGSTGKYIISVSSGFVGDSYLNNTIDDNQSQSSLFTTDGGIASTGFVLISQFGARVQGNTIIGGTTLTRNWTGTAIQIESSGINSDVNASQIFTAGGTPNQFRTIRLTVHLWG